jgi:hypothetical protein
MIRLKRTQIFIPSTFNLIKEYRPYTEKIIKDIINEKDTTK